MHMSAKRSGILWRRGQLLFENPGVGVGGEVLDDDVDDLVGEGSIPVLVVHKVKRLGIARVRLGGLDDDELVHRAVELVQPHLQDLELVEELERVPHSPRVMALCPLGVRANVAWFEMPAKKRGVRSRVGSRGCGDADGERVARDSRVMFCGRRGFQSGFEVIGRKRKPESIPCMSNALLIVVLTMV